MKYFKYTDQCPTTKRGIGLVPRELHDTPVSPELPGLAHYWLEGYWHYGTADDAAVGDPSNDIFELDAAQLHFDLSTTQEADCHNLLNEMEDDYNDIVAVINSEHPDQQGDDGATRYASAKEVVDGTKDKDTTTTAIKDEATAASKTVAVLCAEIVADYDAWQAKLTKLSNLKTTYSDRCKNYKVSDSNAATTKADFLTWKTKTETIGTLSIDDAFFQNAVDDGIIIDSDDDDTYTMKFYHPNLKYRWRIS